MFSPCLCSKKKQGGGCSFPFLCFLQPLRQSLYCRRLPEPQWMHRPCVAWLVSVCNSSPLLSGFSVTTEGLASVYQFLPRRLLTQSTFTLCPRSLSARCAAAVRDCRLIFRVAETDNASTQLRAVAHVAKVTRQGFKQKLSAAVASSLTDGLAILP